jgi:NADH-quinone oxidoreductase subunit F
MSDLTVKRLTQRCGNIDPSDISEYISTGGYKALVKALLTMKPQDIIDEVKASGLLGRGGAAFPTGLKMQMVHDTPGDVKYVVCNADEGEPGTFKDRYLMEGDPYQLVEGIILAGYAVGAQKAYIYIRGEYDHAIELLKNAVEQTRKVGYLGDNILKQRFNFDIEVRSGAGAYICGEEFALIESLEGKSGRPRYKPPYPPISGLWDRPTLINNVETLANIPYIVSNGSKAFRSVGTDNSAGTKLICLSGNIVNRGVLEVPFGITLKDIIYDIGQGVPDERELKMIQIGGASGSCISSDMLDVKLDFADMKKNGLSMGSGAIIAFDDSRCVIDIVKSLLKFFAHESCGKCTPCREGNPQLYNLIDDFSKGSAIPSHYDVLQSLTQTMQQAALCGLGQASPMPVVSTLQYFKDEYDMHINGHCPAGICSSINGGEVR